VGLVVFSVFAIGFRVVGVDSGGASRPQSSSEAIRGAGQPEGGGGLSRVVSRPITFAREDGVAGCCGAVQHLSRPVSFLAAEAPEGTGSATLDGPYAKYLRVPALTSDLVSLAGVVRDDAGNPVAGARLRLEEGGVVVGEATSGEDGRYDFPPLPGEFYCLSIERTGFADQARFIVLNPATALQDIGMPASPPSAPLVNDGSPAPPKPEVDEDGEGRLMACGPWGLGPARGHTRTDRMTIIMTHGWNSEAGGWPALMARALLDRLGTSEDGSPKVNLLAWDWGGAAAGLLPPETKTPAQGLSLGRALEEELGVGYSGDLHFLGHSLGTLVNARAADYLHGDTSPSVKKPPGSVDFAWWRTHMTLLDQAELARVTEGGMVVLGLGGVILAPYTGGLSLVAGAGVAFDPGNSPLPEKFAWADNYVSLVGLTLDGAVNVALPRAVGATPTERLMASWPSIHGYPIEWYQRSLTSGSHRLLGIWTSWEGIRHLDSPISPFPPVAAELRPPAKYWQVPGAVDEMALERAGSVGWLLGRTELAVGAVVSTVTGAIRCTGSVAATVVETSSRFAEQLLRDMGDDLAKGLASAADLAYMPALSLRFETEGGGSGGFLHQPPMDQAAAPYAWLPLKLPQSAEWMTFEFTVSGDPVDDVLAVHRDGALVFAQPLKHIKDGARAASPPIDVSRSAGAQAEMGWGVLGGTSAGLQVTVENIRFLSFGPPDLMCERKPEGLDLSWPLTAASYRLETSPTLSPSRWERLSTVPETGLNRYRVRVDWTGGERYFRLRRATR